VPLLVVIQVALSYEPRPAPWLLAGIGPDSSVGADVRLQVALLVEGLAAVAVGALEGADSGLGG